MLIDNAGNPGGIVARILWRFADGCKVLTTKTQRRTQKAQKLFGLAGLCFLFAL
jgi:hypothetical protein